MMNIAFFTDTFIPKFDGIVTSILNTIGELLRRGHKVMVFAPKIHKDQLDIIKKYNPDIKVMLIPGVNALFYPEFKLTPPASPWIIRELKKFNVDIIHFHTPFTMGMEAIIASRILKKPLVSTFHTYFCEPEYLKIVKLDWVPGLVKFGWLYSNFFHNRCSVTLSPSHFSAGKLAALKVKSPIKVLSNGIPLQVPRSLDDSEREELRKKYNLKEHVMLFVGRVSEEKCIDVLIDAAKLVVNNRNDTVMLIVGDGPASGKYKQLVKNSGLSEQVIFTGAIPHKDLIQSGIFEISDFFVTASTSENQPMTIIEACMFGLPLIGVDAKGVPEMIKDNGFVAEPGNSKELAEYMLKIVEDENLRRQMSEKSKIFGDTYNIEKTTDQLLEIYNNLTTE
jgi:1,2-diacylglycerol 3-alpha-glucosyltransferase